MPKSSILNAIILSLLLTHSVRAFPFGAGSCRSGGGVGGTHLGDNNGTIVLGNAQFAVNGQLLNEGDVVTLNANTTNELKLMGEFKGFLMKVSGNTDELGYIPNAYGTLGVIDDENSKILPRTSDSISQSSCLDNEAGMSHTNNNLKESITSKFMYDGKGDFTLEVTIVNGNKGTDNDGWYYSQYQFVMEKSLIEETSTPLDVEPVDVEEIPETGDEQKTPESSASSLLVLNINMLLFGIGLSLFFI